MKTKPLDIISAICLALATGPADAANETASADVPSHEASALMGDCGQQPYSILITVHDVRHSEGTITVDLHGDDPDKFLGKGERLDRIRAPAVEGETQICIPVVEPGVYAFALYHDEDGDTKFDKNFIGLPAEPFGLSNDPPIRLAKPKHAECAFEVTGPLTPVGATLHH
jgi:uncharacterized protein (DUF2141 family)